MFQILTKDSVTVRVDAVVYYRIRDAVMSVCNIDDVKKSTRYVPLTYKVHVPLTLGRRWPPSPQYEKVAILTKHCQPVLIFAVGNCN